MGDAIEEKFYRLADGRPARLRVLVDQDQDRLNPRKDEANGSVMVTWERDYLSPDKREYVPAEIEPATYRWHDYGRGIEAHKVARYCRIFRTDDVLYIGAVSRNGYDGSLSVDDDPREGKHHNGIVVVTLETLRETHGVALPEGDEARRIARELGHWEVGRYSAWATGNCYGYEVQVPAFPGADIDHDPEVITDCWGYIGDDEIPHMTSQAEGELDNGWAEITEHEFAEICSRARDQLVKVASGIEYA